MDDKIARRQAMALISDTLWRQNSRILRDRLIYALEQLKTAFRNGDPRPKSSFVYYLKSLQGKQIENALVLDDLVIGGFGIEAAVQTALKSLGLDLEDVQVNITEDIVELPPNSKNRHCQGVIIGFSIVDSSLST